MLCNYRYFLVFVVSGSLPVWSRVRIKANSIDILRVLWAAIELTPICPRDKIETYATVTVN